MVAYVYGILKTGDESALGPGYCTNLTFILDGQTVEYYQERRCFTKVNDLFGLRAPFEQWVPFGSDGWL
jgi:hypothetical protein